MRLREGRMIVVMSVVLFEGIALAQDPLTDVLRMGFTDVAETKRKAEAGDPKAQLALGDAYAGQNRYADAVKWYWKAAQQGQGEAIYRLGKRLLTGAQVGGDQSVAADPVTGMGLIFCMATNRHAPAYYDLYKAYRDGICVAKDVVQSYAWLQLTVDAETGLLPSTHRGELNTLALAVDVATAQQGKRLAAAFKRGEWPHPVFVAPEPPPGPKPASSPPKATAAPAAPAKATPAAKREYPELKLKAISPGVRTLANINGIIIEEGQTITVPLKPKAVKVKCVKIERNSILVSVDGEESPRRLEMR
jgi:TPR repeat protein